MSSWENIITDTSTIGDKKYKKQDKDQDTLSKDMEI